MTVAEAVSFAENPSPGKSIVAEYVTLWPGRMPTVRGLNEQANECCFPGLILNVLDGFSHVTVLVVLLTSTARSAAETKICCEPAFWTKIVNFFVLLLAFVVPFGSTVRPTSVPGTACGVRVFDANVSPSPLPGTESLSYWSEAVTSATFVHDAIGWTDAVM